MVEKWVKISISIITISLIVHWILFIIVMEELKQPVTLMRLEEAKNIPDDIKDVYKNVFVKKLNEFETKFFDSLQKGVVYADDDDDDDDPVPPKIANKIIANNMKNNISDTFVTNANFTCKMNSYWSIICFTVKIIRSLLIAIRKKFVYWILSSDAHCRVNLPVQRKGQTHGHSFLCDQ